MGVSKGKMYFYPPDMFHNEEKLEEKRKECKILNEVGQKQSLFYLPSFFLSFLLSSLPPSFSPLFLLLMCQHSFFFLMSERIFCINKFNKKYSCYIIIKKKAGYVVNYKICLFTLKSNFRPLTLKIRLTLFYGEKKDARCIN